MHAIYMQKNNQSEQKQIAVKSVKVYPMEWDGLSVARLGQNGREICPNRATLDGLSFVYVGRSAPQSDRCFYEWRRMC